MTTRIAGWIDSTVRNVELGPPTIRPDAGQKRSLMGAS